MPPRIESEIAVDLNSAAKAVRERLRRRIGQDAGNGGAAPELHAALEEIETLWEELLAQSGTLADERRRYAEFFEFAPEPYVVTEPHGEIREANRAARELLGEALAGTPLSLRVPEGERSAFRARLIEARGKPESEVLEWRGALSGAAAAAGGAAEPVPAVPVLFRVRTIKVRRKNAGGLCWLIRRLESGPDGQCD